jgi:hypothetical protein
MKARIELAALLGKMFREGETAEGVTQKEILEKTVKRKETSSCHILPADFSEVLREMVNAFNANGEAENFEGGLSFKVGATQADPLLAGRAVKRNSDAIMSADSDFAALVEPSGLYLSSWHFDAKKQELSQLLLSTTDTSVTGKIEWLLHNKFPYFLSEHVGSIFQTPDCPIFSSESCPTVRAIMSVILGCDTYEKGVSGIGASSTLQKWLLKCQHLDVAKDRADFLLQEVASNIKGSPSKGAMMAFARAFLFKPTNERDDKGLRTYIYESPMGLPLYLKDFGNEIECEIESDLEVLQCIGTGLQSHSCLKVEGFHECACCKKICCKLT